MMHTGTVTLTEFLLARIAEDEEAAKGVNRGLWNSRVALLPPDLYGHVARQHPQRVLAECEAKRRIVKSFEKDRRLHLNAPDQFTEAAFITGLLATAWLGTIYANHPDYREEWRP